jgi:hypothetical protein
MTEHPITPPPELVQQWINEVDEGNIFGEHLASRAAQWGADRELEACIHWLITGPYGASIACNADHMIGDLRAARRPKPPSLKEQALSDLADAYNADKIDDTTYENIRRALEALPE